MKNGSYDLKLISVNRFNVVAGALLLLVIVFQFYTYVTEPKIAYLQAEKVFGEFKLKKDLERDLEKSNALQKKILDSMKLNLQMAYENVSRKKDQKLVMEYKIQEQQYFLKEKQTNDAYAETAEQYTAQIWKQLNQYIQEYGDQHGYDYIYGLKSEGELMYGKKSHDITDELVKVVNDKYNNEKE